MTDDNSQDDFYYNSSYLNAEITYGDAEPVVNETRDSGVPFYSIDDDELITARIFSNDDRFDPNNEELPEEPIEEEYSDSEFEVGHDVGQNTKGTSTRITQEQCPTFLNKNVDQLEIGYESEGIEKCPSNEDVGNDAPDYSYYSAPKEISNIRFHIGLKFTTIREARSAVRDYAVGCGYDVRFKKNDSVRLEGICVPGCKWRIFISQVSKKQFFQVKRFKDVHTCSKTRTNKNATRDWLVGKITPLIQRDFKTTTRQVVEFARQIIGVEITQGMGYKVRIKCFDMIHGSYIEQYRRIRDYALEILRSNPGATCVVKTEFLPHISRGIYRFQRMYVCLPGVRDGFRHCRPLICLDGCFLKSHNRNQLLTAVGRDANDLIYPIAFAVVDKEDEYTWEWFLNLLLNDIGSIAENNWVFMSDQQKGLVSLLNDWGVEHRWCVRHLYSNFRVTFPSEELRKLMWYAAKATNEGAWIAAMNKIKAVSVPAYDKLMTYQKNHWCLHAFGPRAKSDTLVNNMCETFNSVILEARELPIVSMIEWLLRYLMNRLRGQENVMANYVGLVCPRIKRRIDKYEDYSRSWFAQWSGENKYLVDGFETHYNVNLTTRDCTCGLWTLLGIQCPHAIACIRNKREPIERYVDDCYKPETFMRIYSGMVNGTNGKEQWPVYDGPDLAPPKQQKKRGRPQIKRRKAPEEAIDKASRRGNKQFCKRCGNSGHNRRTYKVVIDEASLQGDGSVQTANAKTQDGRSAILGEPGARARVVTDLV